MKNTVYSVAMHKVLVPAAVAVPAIPQEADAVCPSVPAEPTISTTPVDTAGSAASAEPTRSAIPVDAVDVTDAVDAAGLIVSKESLQVLASFIQIMGQNGFLVTGELAQALAALDTPQLRQVTGDVVDSLSSLNLGRRFTCMYPGFPRTVMNARRLTLYFGAMLHYLSDGRIRLNLDTEPVIHPELVSVKDPITLTLMKQHEVTQVIRALLQAQTMWTPDQTEWIRGNLSANAVQSALRAGVTIPHRANAAVVCGQFLQKPFVSSLVATQTDVLRIAATLFRSDPLLEKPGRFRRVPRAQRRRLLELLEAVSLPANAKQECPRPYTADLRRHERYWKALSSALHPGEYQTQYPYAFAVFRALWTDTLDPTFAGAIERAYRAGEGAREKVIALFERRPGEFSRGLFRLLHTFPSLPEQLATLRSYLPLLPQLDTMKLIGMWELVQNTIHASANTDDDAPANTDTGAVIRRVFLPKGGSRAPFVREEPTTARPPLYPLVQTLLLSHVQSELILRFSQKAPLGKVYIAPEADQLRIPRGQTATSGALRDMARGSRLSLAPGCQVLRAFVFWKNPTVHERVDVDLSAICYTEDLTFVRCISYFDLKSSFACHSGDIVDAPNGAAEYIDIDFAALEQWNEQKIKQAKLAELANMIVDSLHDESKDDRWKEQKSKIATLTDRIREELDDEPEDDQMIDRAYMLQEARKPIRYIGFTANVFTGQLFHHLPICSAGWMERADMDSGEIWEPATVDQQFNLNAATRQVTMFLLDVRTREIIWLDRPGSHEFRLECPNNVITRAAAQKAALMAELTGSHLSLGDFLRWHVSARGELVDTPEQADFTIMPGGDIDPYGFSRVIGDWLSV